MSGKSLNCVVYLQLCMAVIYLGVYFILPLCRSFGSWLFSAFPGSMFTVEYDWCPCEEHSVATSETDLEVHAENWCLKAACSTLERPAWSARVADVCIVLMTTQHAVFICLPLPFAFPPPRLPPAKLTRRAHNPGVMPLCLSDGCFSMTEVKWLGMANRTDSIKLILKTPGVDSERSCSGCRSEFISVRRRFVLWNANWTAKRI